MTTPVADGDAIQDEQPERTIATLQRMSDVERRAHLHKVLLSIGPEDGSCKGLLTTFNPFRQEMLDIIIPPGQELEALRIIIPPVGLFSNSASPWLLFLVCHPHDRRWTWFVRDTEDEIIAHLSRASKINYIEVFIKSISDANSHIITLWHKLMDVSRVLKGLPLHGHLSIHHDRPEPHGMEFFDRRPFHMDVNGQVIDSVYPLFHLTSTLLILPTRSRYLADRPDFTVNLGTHSVHFHELGEFRISALSRELPRVHTYIARALDDVEGHEGNLLRLKRMSLYHAKRSCLGARSRQLTCPGDEVDRALREHAEYLRTALDPKATDDKKLEKAALRFFVLSPAHQKLYEVNERWRRDQWADLYPGGLPPFAKLHEFLVFRQAQVEFCRANGLEEE